MNAFSLFVLQSQVECSNTQALRMYVRFHPPDQKVYLKQKSRPHLASMWSRNICLRWPRFQLQSVCVIDSEYDYYHPDLPECTIVTGTASSKPWYQDMLGLGTHVAGTIAAIGGGGDQGVQGVSRPKWTDEVAHHSCI